MSARCRCATPSAGWWWSGRSKCCPTARSSFPSRRSTGCSKVLRVRVVLESEAGALAAGHATSGLVDSLNSLQKKIAAPTLSKQQEFFALNREFHFAIYQAAHSPLLFSMIEQLWLQIGPVFSHTSMDYVSGGADAHEKIIAALVARDADATRAAIAEDLTRGGERFAAALAGAQ